MVGIFTPQISNKYYRTGINHNVLSRLREVLEKMLIEYIKLKSLQLLQCKNTKNVGDILSQYSKTDYPL